MTSDHGRIKQTIDYILLRRRLLLAGPQALELRLQFDHLVLALGFEVVFVFTQFLRRAHELGQLVPRPNDHTAPKITTLCFSMRQRR